VGGLRGPEGRLQEVLLGEPAALACGEGGGSMGSVVFKGWTRVERRGGIRADVKPVFVLKD